MFTYYLVLLLLSTQVFYWKLLFIKYFRSRGIGLNASLNMLQLKLGNIFQNYTYFEKYSKDNKHNSLRLA